MAEDEENKLPLVDQSGNELGDDVWERLNDLPWNDPNAPWNKGVVPNTVVDSLKAKMAWLRENPGPEKPDPVEVPFEEIPWEDPKEVVQVKDHQIHFTRLNENIGVMVMSLEGKGYGFGSILTIFSQNKEMYQKFLREKVQSEDGYVEPEGPRHEAYWDLIDLDGKTFWERRDLRTYESGKRRIADRKIWAECGTVMGKDWPDDELKKDKVNDLVRLGILPEGIDNWLLVDKK